MRADRRSVRAQHGLSMREALQQEWLGSKGEVTKGIIGAARFASGKGRGGDFSDVWTVTDLPPTPDKGAIKTQVAHARAGT